MLLSRCMSQISIEKLSSTNSSLTLLTTTLNICGLPAALTCATLLTSHRGSPWRWWHLSILSSAFSLQQLGKATVVRDCIFLLSSHLSFHTLCLWARHLSAFVTHFLCSISELCNTPILGAPTSSPCCTIPLDSVAKLIPTLPRAMRSVQMTLHICQQHGKWGGNFLPSCCLAQPTVSCNNKY